MWNCTWPIWGAFAKLPGGTKKIAKIVGNTLLIPRFEQTPPKYCLSQHANILPSDICLQKLPQQINLTKPGIVLFFN
jgi:hypothetical protein